MRQWAKNLSNMHDEIVDTYTMLDVIYGLISKEEVSKPTSKFKRLQAWDSPIASPHKFWFIPDCGTLLFIENYMARNRNGEVNREYTPQVSEAEDCWCWIDVLGTTRLHNHEQYIPFSKYSVESP